MQSCLSLARITQGGTGQVPSWGLYTDDPDSVVQIVIDMVGVMSSLRKLWAEARLMVIPCGRTSPPLSSRSSTKTV